MPLCCELVCSGKSCLVGARTSLQCTGSTTTSNLPPEMGKEKSGKSQDSCVTIAKRSCGLIRSDCILSLTDTRCLFGRLLGRRGFSGRLKGSKYIRKCISLRRTGYHSFGTCYRICWNRREGI